MDLSLVIIQNMSFIKIIPIRKKVGNLLSL
nr:MAG TPA: hypothetical protein [Bacteriophage sp.]